MTTACTSLTQLVLKSVSVGRAEQQHQEQQGGQMCWLVLVELVLEHEGAGTLVALLPRPKQQCAPHLARFNQVNVGGAGGVQDCNF